MNNLNNKNKALDASGDILKETHENDATPLTENNSELDNYVKEISFASLIELFTR